MNRIEKTPILGIIFISFLSMGCTDDAQRSPENNSAIDFSFSTADMATDSAQTNDAQSMKDASDDVIENSDVGQTCTCPNNALCVLDLCIPDLNENTSQLPNLPDAPQSDRFILPTDRVWPDDTSSPIITLWHDDKYAALSITIDDNPGPDFDWWLDASNQFGFKVTWCVISDIVEAGNSFYGVWADYQKLVAQGHSLCSHGTIADEPPDANAVGANAWFDEAYRLSFPLIESKVPAAKVDTIAHPWGKFIRPLVAQYYLAGRGVRGGVNKANQIDYMDLRSTSRGISKASVDEIMGNGATGRGWFMAHFHYLKDNLRQQTMSELQYLGQFTDEIWVGRFPDISKYGQQRDTATLTLHSSTSEHQIFSLVDGMDDEKFDFPLTIKTRLPDEWSQVKTLQNGAPIDHRIVEHQGGNFLLVQAIPNRGPIVVVPN